MLKYYDTHFDDYLCTSDNNNFHPKIDSLIENLSPELDNMHNMIVYGKSGVGKYTQALKIIRKYSPTSLKYEKRMHIDISKVEYIVRMSDVHFELDMSLLGCNAKLVWNDIYNQIVDIISSRSLKGGIIMCKNMQCINSDLLDILYSYIQKDVISNNICIRFLFITESVCFFPDTILDTCEVIGLTSPPITKLKKQVKPYNNVCSFNESILNSPYHNIKSLYENHSDKKPVQELIINNICSKFDKSIKELKFSDIRDMIYELFIYEVDIPVCVWEILKHLITNKKITDDNTGEIVCETFKFFKLYNNNYRPIYHVEKYFLVLDRLMNKV